MNKIKILSLALFLGLFSIACNDMLKEDQKGVYSESNFFDSKENAISSLLSIYKTQKGIEFASRFQYNLMDLPTNQYSTYGKSVESLFYTWDVSPITEEFTYFFKYIYLCINKANNVIENVAKMDPKVISSSDRDQIVGEAYLLRAYFHFMAVRTWGKIPVHTSQVKSPDQANVTYSSIQDAYKVIIADLEKATSMMKIQKIQGRTDIVAAQALLAKVYLTMASSKMTGAPGYEWVSDAEAMYSKAAEWSGKVVNGQNTYSLEPDISRLFNVDYENSPEYLWITERTRVYDRENHPMMFGNSIATKYIPKKLGAPVTGPGDVELYIAKGQGGWNFYRPDSLFYKSYNNSDLRKQLMLTEIYDEKGQLVVKWTPDNINSSDAAKKAFYYPMCRKYHDPYSPDINTSSENYIMRFAEVLLTYAEAVGPTTEGYAAINKVRKRANLPDLQSGLSKTDFRKKVWDELTFELAFEGYGLLELRRTNRVLEAITKPYVVASKLKDYAYFYPIPQREADLNPQN
jgi:starch-binding outer membrane protein, SusD/RagB family